jgi:hypothetical protein
MEFLCLLIGKNVTWTNRTDKMVPKLNAAWYALRSMSHINNTDTHKSIYFAIFAS